MEADILTITNLPEGYSIVYNVIQSSTEKHVAQIALGKDTQRKIISLASDMLLFGISTEDALVQLEITKCLEKEPPIVLWLSSLPTAEEPST